MQVTTVMMVLFIMRGVFNIFDVWDPPLFRLLVIALYYTSSIVEMSVSGRG
jgi:hypothetical protein